MECCELCGKPLIDWETSPCSACEARLADEACRRRWLLAGFSPDEMEAFYDGRWLPLFGRPAVKEVANAGPIAA